MTKYFQWLNDFNFPSADDIIIPDGWIEIELFAGKKIEKKLPPLELIFNKDYPSSDSIPSKKVLLFFSARLVKFIEDNYPKGIIQTFPVEIKCKSEKSEEGKYFLVNILNSKDVIDNEKSKLKLDKYGDILNIEKLEIVDDDFDNNDFFRLSEFGGLLICSESFVHQLKDNGFTGMKFTPISKLFI